MGLFSFLKNLFGQTSKEKKPKITFRPVASYTISAEDLKEGKTITVVGDPEIRYTEDGNPIPHYNTESAKDE